MMHQLMVKMIALVMLATTVACSGMQEDLLRAHEAYKQGNFSRAYDMYAVQQPKTPVILYNMGNCAFKQDQLGKALLHWRQAELDWGLGGHEELRGNIAHVENMLQARSAGASKDAQTHVHSFRRVQAAMTSFVRMIPLVALQAVFLVFWLLLFLYVRFLLKKKKRFIFLCFFLILSGAGSLMVYKYSVRTRRHGIVLSKEVAVYSGPATTYQRIGALHEGDEVVLKTEIDNFYKIKAQKYLGWVAREAIGII